MRRWCLAGMAFLSALVLAAPARAQIEAGAGAGRYESMFGAPVDVSLDDLIQNPTSYEDRAVRTKGRLELNMTQGSRRTYMLRGTFMNGALLLAPMPEVAGNWESEAPRLIGRDVEVTGVFRAGQAVDPTNPTMAPSGIQFWQYVGPPEEGPKGAPIKANEVTLEKLVSRPGSEDGHNVRVVGKFRGRNLYGDLPARSERASSDWVIKDDVYAVWVTGKKPKGSGWELDASLKRDTGKWIEVVGRPETRGGVTYLRAVQVTLSAPPTPTAEVQPPPPPPPKPKVPPVVVFSLPLDGEGEVPSDSRFVVQFNKDMDEKTFEGRVQLRYAGPPRPGDRAFDGIKLSYDGGLRALTVDPGDLLRSGRQLELVLLPGIADTEGLTLVARPGRETGDVIDVLHYVIGG
jgi:hypothetical protein